MTPGSLRRKLLNYIDANADRLGGDGCELLHYIADALSDLPTEEQITACVVAELVSAEWSFFEDAIRTGVRQALAPPADERRGVMDLAKWISIAEQGPPNPEVFVLCWDGRNTFVDWFGSKPDAGRGVTHWAPYEKPPGDDVSDMHDGTRAAIVADLNRGHPQC